MMKTARKIDGIMHTADNRAAMVAAIAAAVLLLVFGPLAHVAEAQFVRFSVNTQPDVSFVETEPIEMPDTQEAGLSDMGRSMEADGTQSFSCMALGSGENIKVLVHVELKDTFIAPGRERPVSLDARYINDRGGCPTDPAMAAAVSSPFDADGRALFRLNREAVTRAGLNNSSGSTASRRSDRFFTAFLFLNLSRQIDPEAGAVDRRRDMEYRGTYTVDITYL